MKINFIIPANAKTGGIAVVLEYTRYLRKAGHDVRIYAPMFPYPIYSRRPGFFKRIYGYAVDCLLTARGLLRGLDWFPGNMRSWPVPFVRSTFIRDADAVIATAWPTAYDVARLPEGKGRKFYFIQHYEDWNGSVEALDGSFRLPLDLLTIAPWLTALMRTRFGRPVAAEVHNGIDLETFHPPAEKRPAPVTLLMMHHVLAIKGTADGLYALRKIHALFPEVKIRLFGMFPFEEGDDFIEHVRDPSRAQLAAMYRQAHIFLTPSLSEGWHLPPMEALASGCAVVATRVGCIPVLERDGNLLSVEPGDREGLFLHLKSLIENPALREETARKGAASMLEYGWDKKGREFEKALVSARPGFHV